ncbi:MAG: aminopeptidase P family protein [Spirochaetales bacterium]|nr:aminopeptidase P family protein [Spirochaetales bacterium]
MNIFEVFELEDRVKKLQDVITAKGLDMVLFSYPRDIYYYTGSYQPLYMVVSAGKGITVIARKGIERIKEEVKHIKLMVFRNTKEFFSILAEVGLQPESKIGICYDTFHLGIYKKISETVSKVLFEDISWEVRLLRAVKSTREIAYHREAARIMNQIPDILINEFKPGMSELELSAVLENYFRLSGLGINHSRQEGADFGYGICSAGVRSGTPTRFNGISSGQGLSPAVPFGATKSVVEKGVPVLLDYGVTWEGYHIDMSRMFCWGRPEDEVQKAYQAMGEIEEAVIEKLKPGVLWQEPYDLALKMAEERGYADTFMGIGTEKVKFVGHGVGIELDEPPFIAPNMEYPLEEGMVIAIEPKVNLPGRGVIGIEDTVVIGNSGVEWLTLACRDIIIRE